MYAIIEDSGSQIKVSKGDVIKVDPRDLPEDSVSIDFDRVMMVGGDKPKIGQPLVEGAKVTGEILSEEREEKIEVVKFRKRKGYRRRRGHRQPFVRVKITEISA